jgi:hypothetical protein
MWDLHRDDHQIDLRVRDEGLIVVEGVLDPVSAGRSIGAFLAPRAERDELVLRERPQGRNVRHGAPAAVGFDVDNPDADLLVCHRVN